MYSEQPKSNTIVTILCLFAKPTKPKLEKKVVICLHEIQ